MPQVVKTQPTGAFSQGQGSIGAVIFDKPQYDTTTIAMKVAEDLNDWGARKQKEVEAKRERLYALTKDLYQPDSKETLTEHSPLIKAAADETIKAQAEYFSELAKSNGETTPASIEAQRKFAEKRNQTELIVNQSREGYKRIGELVKDPQKLKDMDIDDLESKVVEVRTKMPGTTEYENALQGLSIKPKKKSLYDLVQAKTKDIGESVESGVSTKGGIIKETKTTRKFTPEQLKPENLPTQIYFDKEVKDVTDELFNRYLEASKKPLNQMTQAEKADYVAFQKYVDESASSGGKYDPRVYAVQDYLMAQNYIKEDEQSKGETEASKVSAGAIKNKKHAEGIIKFLAQVQYGDQDVYTTISDPGSLGEWNGEFYGTKAFGNLSYGKRPIKVKTDDGEQEVAVPNLIRYFWREPKTGILRVATDETVQNFKDKKASSPWLQIDNVSQIVPTMGGEFVGEDVSGFLSGYTDAIKDNKWGLDGSTTKFNPLVVNPGMRRVGETPTVEVRTVPTVTYDEQGRRVAKESTGAAQKPQEQKSDNRKYTVTIVIDGKEYTKSGLTKEQMEAKKKQYPNAIVK